MLLIQELGVVVVLIHESVARPSQPGHAYHTALKSGLHFPDFHVLLFILVEPVVIVVSKLELSINVVSFLLAVSFIIIPTFLFVLVVLKQSKITRLYFFLSLLRIAWNKFIFVSLALNERHVSAPSDQSPLFMVHVDGGFMKPPHKLALFRGLHTIMELRPLGVVDVGQVLALFQSCFGSFVLSEHGKPLLHDVLPAQKS